MEDKDALAEPERMSRLIALRYLLVLLVVPSVLALLTLLVEKFTKLPNSNFSALLDYSYHQAGANADIVIFGDSTAIYGVDTARLSNELHKRVVNLPNTAGSLPVTRDASLRIYLQANKPPALIVFYFAPWNMNVGNQNNSHMYEGEEMLLRHGTTRQWFAFSLRHPIESALFPLRFYSIALTDVKLVLHPQDAPGPIVLGHTPYPNGKPLAHSCSYTPFMIHPASSAFVQTLVGRYATPSTKVIVYPAPIPGCTGAIPWHQVVPTNINPSSLQVLSPEGFANDGEFGHALPATTQPITDRLAGVIRNVLP